MKRTFKFTIFSCLFSVFLFLAFSQTTVAQLLLYDDFTGYTVGINLAGQNGWTKGGSGPDATVGNTPLLTYVNYNGGGGENVIMPTPTSTSSRVYKALTSNPAPGTNTFYYSFLLNLTTTTAASGNYFMAIGDPGTGTTYFARIFAQTSGTGFNLGIGKLTNTATYGTTVYNLNQTYLVIVRYDFFSGSANDNMYLWVNPVLTSEPLTANAEVSIIATGTDGNPATVGNFHWHNRGTANPVGYFDGVRVAYGATSASAWTNLDAYLPSGTPTITVVPATLTGFSYIVGSGPSASQNYALSATNLTPMSGNITISPTTNYEVSLDNVSFSLIPITKSYTGGTLTSTPVYVRLKAGLPLGNYNNENITNSGGGAAPVNVTCSGAVVKAEPTNHVTNFTAATGTPSWSTINTTWTDAAGGTIPDGYLVKAATGGYSSIADPVDGITEPDALLVKNITQGIQTASFTGLTDNTPYYFKIYPYTNAGGFINYKTGGTVPQATATTTLSPSITYTWIGPDNGAWTTAIHWTPTRNTPSPNDILLFSGGGTKTITGVPSQTVGKIGMSANTVINLQSNAASTLSIMGITTGTDLDIPAGCALNLNAPNAITIALLTTATASISGNMTFSSTASTAHKLTAVDANSITFNNGAIFTAGTFMSGNPFGTTALNSVIFASGSTFIQIAGSNPFGASQPSSVVVFQTGSLFKLMAGLTPSFSGRTYANFEYDATGMTVSPSGGNPVSIDNLTITNGTFNFNMTSNPGHSIKGNISVGTGGTLNFAPSSAGTVLLNGTLVQSISGAGIITSGANSTLEISNASGILLNTSNATLNGSLKFTNGLLILGTNNLLMGTTGAFSGTPSASAMIVATGSGLLQKGFATGFTGSFLFPVGDTTGTAEYSPVTLNFTGGTFGTGNYAGVNLVNAKYPGDPNTGNYLKRYWSVSQSGITGFSCNATFQYVPADVNGIENQIYCMRVLPLPFLMFDPANTAMHQLTANGLTSFGTFTGTQPLVPTVTTMIPVINITHNSATGGGDVTSDGGSTITARGVCYSTTPNPTIAGPHTTEPGTTGPFTSDITGLNPQTTYYVKAYATNTVGTSYGAQTSFTTLCEPYPPQVDFYASKTNIMVGESIDFFDQSIYCPTSWAWNFLGGEPYSSTQQNPTGIVYNYPGVYTVCLMATNGYGSGITCKEGYITVTAPPAPLNAKIVITEIMYNPPETNVDSLEFIELYNNDTVAMNMENFYFTAGVIFTFPNVTMAPHSYLIVAKSDTAMLNTFGVNVLKWTDGNLNNGGEPIVLYDRMGFMVDSVNYDDAYPWDTLPDARGPSLELCDPDSDNNDPLNWRAAIEFAAINATGDTIWASPLAGCSYPPEAGFIASDTVILQFQTVTFTDTSSGDITGWLWTFESGMPETFNGQNPPPVQYNQMGAFDVTLTVSNIAGHSTLIRNDYIEVGASGLKGNSFDGRLVIYPNPSSGSFTILSENQRSAFIDILDQLGKVVFTQKMEQQKTEVRISGLLPGFYTVKLTDGKTGKTSTGKLIIQ